MIIKKNPAVYEKQKIDLTGPDGNVFFLIATARRWMKQIDPERVDSLVKQMISGEYSKAVAYFEIHFGPVCDLEMEDWLADEVQAHVDRIRGTEDIEWDLNQLGFD